jgi:hypothetical protein
VPAATRSPGRWQRCFDSRRSTPVGFTINRALSTSAKKINEARNHLGSLVAELEAALAGIESEIAA